MARRFLPIAFVFVVISMWAGCSAAKGGGGDPAPATDPATKASLSAVKHIIFMAQENRSFDHYFGHLNQYRAANGLPAGVDGMPDNASNPSWDGSGTVSAFHMASMCVENPSPSWNESHHDFNRDNPTSDVPLLNGFVRMAALDAQGNGMNDVHGLRAMSYYNADDLPYYYFMASQFATSDRWFSPVMTRTQPNRMYLIAGTSAGRTYPLEPTAPPLPNKTIFEVLDEHSISWKIYITDYEGGSPLTYLSMFTYVAKHPEKIVPMSQYFTDVAQGQLPQVAMIESGYGSGSDEHPAEGTPKGSVQVGSHYVSTLINSLMQSPSWKDSVFILTFDEAGGFYDHVPPQPAVSPDGIPPSDLRPGDVCTASTGKTCDFKYTGYRVPLVVVSPFAKKHYVSHTVTDYTAILKLIETRFGLPNLTARDAAQMDMTEFFDFNGVPWRTPPTPPEQPTGGPCYLDHLP